MLRTKQEPANNQPAWADAMLIYFKTGPRDFTTEPIPVNSRGAWEFYSNLTGALSPVLIDGDKPQLVREPTLWVFPREHPHGWVGDENIERLVFHFTAVPSELEKMVPSRGYYQVALGDDDCVLLRRLAELAKAIMEHPTKLIFLQTHALISQLSLIALREIKQPPLTSRKMARSKTEQALAWYGEHLAQSPTFKDLASAVGVSPTHLRRFFHWVRGENPHEAMNRIRMERAEDVLKGTNLTLDAIATQVGLSNSSALSRAVKAYFGITPRDLRRGKRPIYFGPASVKESKK